MFVVCSDSAAHETAAAAPEPGGAGRSGKTAGETVGGRRRRRVPASAGAGGRAENVRRLEHVRRDVVRAGQLLGARVRPQFAGDGAAHVHAVLRQRDRVRDISVDRPVRRRREYTRNVCRICRLRTTIRPPRVRIRARGGDRSSPAEKNSKKNYEFFIKIGDVYRPKSAEPNDAVFLKLCEPPPRCSAGTTRGFRKTRVLFCKIFKTITCSLTRLVYPLFFLRQFSYWFRIKKNIIW